MCGSKYFAHGRDAHATFMTEIALQHYLAVGAIIFCIGLLGFLCRRNLIVMFLCTELMFQGVAINLIAFGRYHQNTLGQNLSGQAFVIFVLVIAAAEASLALGLVILLFRQKNTLDADAWRELKG
jgi:NADH-quinone oxidoreductase subunit K